VLELLSSFRVVLLGGARQTGKTTLVRDLLCLPGHAWFSFDDEAVLARAIDDPVGLVDALPRPAAVDEFQRAGRGFLLAVKQAADRDRARGQLLLTGSTNYLADRGLSETLAGRAGRLLLWPLSMGERRGVRETFFDHLFEPAAWPGQVAVLARDELVRTVLEGGYPEVVTEGLLGRQRRDWFESYVHDVVSREALRPIAEVRLEAELRRLLRLLAARTGQELVVTGLAGDAENWSRDGFQLRNAVGSLASDRGKSQIAYHCLVVGVVGLGSFGFAGGGTPGCGMQGRRTVVGGCSYRSVPPREHPC